MTLFRTIYQEDQKFEKSYVADPYGGGPVVRPLFGAVLYFHAYLQDNYCTHLMRSKSILALLEICNFLLRFVLLLSHNLPQLEQLCLRGLLFLSSSASHLQAKLPIKQLNCTIHTFSQSVKLLSGHYRMCCAGIHFTVTLVLRTLVLLSRLGCVVINLYSVLTVKHVQCLQLKCQL